MVKFFSSNFFWFSLVSLMASFFRVTNMDLIEFKADEAINLFLASRPLFGYPFLPGSTVSSLGILNFPLLNYILFPYVLISQDPQIITFIIGLINSLAIGFLFLIFKKYYGIRIALIASFLFAFSPWAIIFSRKIWAQDFIIPLSVPLIWSLHKIVSEKKERFWVLFVTSSLFLIQLHQSSIFFLLPLVLFLLIKNKPKIKYLTLGFLIGLLPALHYLLYQLINGCPDCLSLINTRQRLTQNFFPIIFARPFQILGRGNIQTVIGDDMVNFLKQFPVSFNLQKVFYLEYILLPLGFYAFWKAFKKLRFLLLSIIALPFLYFVFHIEPFLHYFIIVIPFLFLFLAFSIDLLLKNKLFIMKGIGLLIFLAILTSSISFNLSFFELIKRERGLKGDYGQIFSQSEKNHKQSLKEYINDPYYKEMLIISYIPLNLLHGNIGIAKMLYDEKTIENNLNLIEKRLREVPQDPRIHAELVYYYTRSKPTKETVFMLAEKAKDIKGYQAVHGEVERFYLEK